jgi:hypothetical protein
MAGIALQEQRERGGLRVGGQSLALPPVLTCQVVPAAHGFLIATYRIVVTKRYFTMGTTCDTKFKRTCHQANLRKHGDYIFAMFR